MINMPLEVFKQSIHADKFAYRKGTKLYNENGREIGRITPDNNVKLRLPS